MINHRPSRHSTSVPPSKQGRPGHELLGDSRRLLFIASVLPARSETFVYREVLGLRRRDWPVAVASVRSPQRNLGDPNLEKLACEAVPVYGAGLRRLVADALGEGIAHPLRAIGTLAQCAADLLRATDAPLRRRSRIVLQCLGAIALTRRIRPLNIAHIHAHMAHVPTTVAMYAAHQLGVGFSFTGHAADLFRDRCLLQVKLRRTEFVCCISRWHRAFYRELLREHETPLPVVRCAVDVNAFAPRDAKQRARIQGSRPATILAVGRLVPKKGFDLLIRAIAALRDEVETFRCIIVGDGPERQRLEQLRNDLELRDAIDFYGERSNHEVRRLLGEVDLFVLPCRVGSDGDRDGIPVVLMEAMASGVAVISGDLPAIRELIEHEHSGLLVEPEKGQAGRSDLARSIADLLHNSDKRMRLARAARRRIEEEFSLETNLSRLERAFENAVGLPRRSDAALRAPAEASSRAVVHARVQ